MAIAMQKIYTTPDMTSAEIQDLIDGAEGKTTVYLSAGTYTFTETLFIDSSNISLIGAGDGATTILADASMASEPVIQLGHGVFTPIILDEAKLSTEANVGDTELTLESEHGLQAGDYIYVTQQNTKEFFDDIGDTLWQKDSDLRTVLLKVNAVEGDTVSFDTALPFDFDPAITTVESREILEGNTLSGFTVQGSWTNADPGDFSNTLGTDNGATMILVAGTSDVELSDISILDAASHGITIAGSADIVLKDIHIDGAADKGAGGNGYGIWIRDVYDSTLSDLTIIDTRHAVVFASYTSATGNVVDVTYTNRDINFHGGLDHDNIVSVEASVRTGDETSYMTPTVFFNEGTTYGAPTDSESNTVVFGTVVGTVRSDVVGSGDNGSHIEVLGGNDVVMTGAGDDYVDLGTGKDVVFASDGHDTLVGGSSYDTVYFEHDEGTYSTAWHGNTLVVSWDENTTSVSGFEKVNFADADYDFEDVPEHSAAATVRWEEHSGDDFDHVDGGDGWERETVNSSTKMGNSLEGISLGGTKDIDVIGSDIGNNILANNGNNQIQTGAGDDRIFGRAGDDIMYGGDGNDFINGQSGDDVLIGGDGDDTLIGGHGADRFVGTQGTNTVLDFDASEGDTIEINSDTDGAFDLAFGLFVQTGESTDDFGFSFSDEGLQITYDDDDRLVVAGATLADFLV